METKTDWKLVHALLPKFENDTSRRLGIAVQKITASWNGLDKNGNGIITVEIRK